MDDLALGEGQAKEAIFAAGIVDDLRNGEKGKLVHLSSLKKS
jgi:hypothetical protein